MAKQNKAKIFGIIVVLFLVFGISTFSSLISFLGDYRWFQELGYTGTFLTKLRTQLIIGLPVFVVIYVLSNFYLTTLKKKYIKEMALVIEKQIEKRIRLGIRGASVLLALFFSVSVTSNLWIETLAFINGQPFNVVDPIFGNDVSFYVFRLPFITGILSLLMSLLFFVILINVVFNLILITSKTTTRMGSDEKIIDFSGYGRKGKNVVELLDKKMVMNILNQIAIFGAAFLFLLAIQFWLRTFDVLYSTRGEVFGAGYTDVLITLNLYRILAVFCIAGAVTFFIGAKKKNVIMAAAIPVLLIIISILGGLASAAVQSFIVSPDEISKETPYLENNIAYTRMAYGLNDITEINYDVNYNLTARDVQNNMDIIENIRINDYTPIGQVYNQIQVIRPYYVFNDIDIDRYMIDGKYTQVFLSARELDQARIDSQAQNWINLVLKYTHGYGLAMSNVNTVTPEGQPVLRVRDIPPRTESDLLITRPEIYFGEKTNTYIIVNTDEEEFDYPSGSDNAMTFYEGEAGIKMTFLNRLLFTIRQGDIRILISNNINEDSKIVLHRNIVERVNKIAPFLAYGHDPYMVVNQEDGRIYWILEGFTHDDKYPYSTPYRGAFNYIRNSVKVVIDAYNGTTDFYIVDDSDALINTYSQIFPDLFKDISDMPEGLRCHLRYAQDYFDIQAEMYRTYHMTNPVVFFGKEDLWEISREKYMDRVQTVESNYLMFKVPGEESVEFLISVPYSPVGRNNMSSLLVGRNDGDNYGELMIYRFPRNENIPGPNMIESRIDQESEISPQLTLWSQEGSNVLRGNLLVIPIEQSLLYVEPIYLQSSGENALPEMQRVIVAYEDRIVMERTLAGALNRIFGDVIEDPDGGENGGGIDDKTIVELIGEANSLFSESQEALKNGEWTRYGQLIEQLRLVLERLDALQE